MDAFRLKQTNKKVNYYIQQVLGALIYKEKYFRNSHNYMS